MDEKSDSEKAKYVLDAAQSVLSEAEKFGAQKCRFDLSPEALRIMVRALRELSDTKPATAERALVDAAMAAHDAREAFSAEFHAHPEKPFDEKLIRLGADRDATEQALRAAARELAEAKERERSSETTR